MTAEDMRFELAVDVVLEHEGGYVDDPKDPGGATQWGISLRFLRQIGYDVDDDGDVDAEDIRKLSKDDAKEIYRRRFWDRYRYGEIKDLTLATKVFDLAVNMGPTAAHRLLQRALHAVGRTDVVVDGVLGTQTLGAVNSACPYAVLTAYRAEAAAYYRRLVEQNSALGRFEKGWQRRAYA